VTRRSNPALNAWNTRKHKRGPMHLQRWDRLRRGQGDSRNITYITYDCRQGGKRVVSGYVPQQGRAGPAAPQPGLVLEAPFSVTLPPFLTARQCSVQQALGCSINDAVAGSRRE
jgi:hypothetical protein